MKEDGAVGEKLAALRSSCLTPGRDLARRSRTRALARQPTCLAARGVIALTSHALVSGHLPCASLPFAYRHSRPISARARLTSFSLTNPPRMHTLDSLPAPIALSVDTFRSTR